MSGGYRSAVRTVVGAAAVSYGYTLVTTTTGGVLIRLHGAPSIGEAFLFLGGSAAGFTLVALLGGGDSEDAGVIAEIDRRWFAVSGALSAAAGLGLAILVAHVIGGSLSFGAGGLTATSIYFMASAGGLAAIGRDRAKTMGRATVGDPLHRQTKEETYDHSN